MKGVAPRVLHVGKFYAPHRGGIETQLQLLCEELSKHMEVRVVVASHDRSTHEEVIGGVRVKRVPTWVNVSSAPVCPGMTREIRESRADIVHLHLPNPAAILAYMASGHKGALICSYHSDVIRQRILGPAFEPILKRALARSSAVIAASPNYIASSPILASVADRCHVIPYGLRLEPFNTPNAAAVREIRNRYGPDLILAVGRLVYYKGFQYLIQAMNKAGGKLLLIGEGPLRADLERQVREQGLGDRILFLGHVEDTVPFYHAAELFVLPSAARSEAFGIVQLEAMACGKPVINTQLDSGVTFVSVDHITGVTVPPGDPDALASAIDFLIQNEHIRTQYGAAGRKRVEQLFTIEAMTEKMLELYAQVSSGFEANARSVVTPAGAA